MSYSRAYVPAENADSAARALETTPPWYVLTGGPCAGKTTLIAEFEKRGYNVLPEAARIVIEELLASGRTLADIKIDKSWFPQVVERKWAMERAVPPSELFFFDRGVPDSLAYYKLFNSPIDEFLRTASEQSKYRKVFLLDLIGFEPDDVRAETPEEAAAVQDMLEQVYRDLGHDVVKVPVIPVSDRADYILARL